jgi:hypothetical protein
MNEPMSTEHLVPPPWKLKGDGLILLYRFTPDFVRNQGWLTPEMGEFRGGLGALMLVDYETSGVGPYREVLFIPGRFRLGNVRAHSISKIYVSTQPSIVSGRANWGIPKEHADFHRTHEDAVQGWQLSTGGREFLKIRYTPGKLPFRVWTFPFFAPLVQHLDGKTFVSRIRAHGVCKLATIHDLQIDPAYLPDVTRAELLGAIRATKFTLTFPVPRIIHN